MTTQVEGPPVTTFGEQTDCDLPKCRKKDINRLKGKHPEDEVVQDSLASLGAKALAVLREGVKVPVTCEIEINGKKCPYAVRVAIKMQGGVYPSAPREFMKVTPQYPEDLRCITCILETQSTTQ